MFSGQDIPAAAMGRRHGWVYALHGTWLAGAPCRMATSPLIRGALGEDFVPLDWGAALNHFRDRFCAAQQTAGAGAVRWITSASLTNEELAFASALAKIGLGLPAGLLESADWPSPAALAIAQAWGDSTAPTSWQVPEESEVILLFGKTVVAESSPLWQRLSINRRQPRLYHLADDAAEPVIPGAARFAPRAGSMLCLIHGLANILIASGWIDHDFVAEETSGFGEYAGSVGPFTTDRVCAETGLSWEEVWELALAIGTGGRVGFCGLPEVEPAAQTEIALAIANLSLLSGHLREPGSGVSAELAFANSYGATLETPSLEELESAAASGKLGALWIIATDGFRGTATRARLLRVAEKAAFVVVQDSDDTSELARAAHLFLPSTGWRGKEGTVLDPSGQLRLLKPRDRLPVAVLTDFRIFQLVAQYWGCGPLFSRWSSPEAAFRLLREELGGPLAAIAGMRDYGEIDGARHDDAEQSSTPTPRVPFVV